MPRKSIVNAVVYQVCERCKAGDAVLDLSCGEGDILTELHARHIRAEGTHYREGDYILRNPRDVLEQATVHSGVDLGKPLPFSNQSYDAVLATEVFEHLPEHPALLQEVGRILKPGGFFLFTTPNVHNLGARLSFLFTGIPAMQGGRLGWHVAPGDLYSTHHHPVDLSIFHSQLRHAGLTDLHMFFTKTDELSVLLGGLTPLAWLGGWLGTRRYRRDHPEGGQDLLRVLRSPATLFSSQLCGVAVKNFDPSKVT